MRIEFTFIDPIAYTEPWSATLNFDLLPDTELIENVCENEKDSGHIVGRTAADDRPPVEVPAEVLREYAGSYGFPGGLGPATDVVLVDGRLVMNGLELVPTSQFEFVANIGIFTFLRDPNGRVIGLRMFAVGEG